MISAEQHTASLQHSKGSLRPPLLHFRPAVSRSLVVRRYREDEAGSSSSSSSSSSSGFLEQLQKTKTDTGLTPEQLEEVYNKEPGNISPRMAEMRADLGNAATSWTQLQAFDGPVVETLNARLAMIGVVLGLLEESVTGRSLWQQIGAHPLRILAVMAVIGAATFVPAARGYTRKEPFVNTFGGLPWIPLAENWNGRLAMVGFALMLFSEGVLKMNTLQAWGLQSLHLGP